MTAAEPRARIRVVIADDSAVMRELLVAMIEEGPDFEIVAVARNGREAVDLTLETRPDVVLMDVHMPELDGHAATRQIMETAPTPVVMISASMKASEVQLSFEALRAGALTLIDKPVNPLSPNHEAAAISLRRTLRLMSEVRVVHRRPARSDRPVEIAVVRPIRRGVRAAALAIAASTGGPSALVAILEALPAPMPFPILIAQHISEGFVEGLAAWLSLRTGHTVAVASDREQLTPGRVWLAPDNAHLVVGPARLLRLVPRGPDDHVCPSGDRLLTSVAAVYGTAAVGVVLTGMGADGAAGLLEIARLGGVTAAQSEETCVVYGMPRKAVENGAATHVGAPLEIARLISGIAGTASEGLG